VSCRSKFAWTWLFWSITEWLAKNRGTSRSSTSFSMLYWLHFILIFVNVFIAYCILLNFRNWHYTLFHGFLQTTLHQWGRKRTIVLTAKQHSGCRTANYFSPTKSLYKRCNHTTLLEHLIIFVPQQKFKELSRVF